MPSGAGASRLPRVLAALAVLGVIVIPIVETAAWATIAYAARTPPDGAAADAASAYFSQVASAWGISVPDPSQVSLLAIGVAWITALAFAAPMMVALWSVRRTFLESAEGRPFSDRSVASFRRFGWASLIAVLVAVVERSVHAVVISTLSPEIQNQLSVGVGSDDFARLFSALLLVAVAHMFAEGRRLAQDVEGLL